VVNGESVGSYLSVSGKYFFPLFGSLIAGVLEFQKWVYVSSRNSFSFLDAWGIENV
jgi:hypothetical protein